MIAAKEFADEAGNIVINDVSDEAKGRLITSLYEIIEVLKSGPVEVEGGICVKNSGGSISVFSDMKIKTKQKG